MKRIDSRGNGIGPLFKWFGSKWLSAKHLPVPLHETIYEPFAGGAGYSMRHYSHKVVIAERNPHIYQLWQWLIKESTEDDIRRIPLNTAEGTDIRTLGLSEGQTLLLKNWQRTNNVGNCWTISSWGNSQWTSNTRARVAEQSRLIKHWDVRRDAWDVMVAPYDKVGTWFIDPPYQYNYQYRGVRLNYQLLSEVALRLKGQVMVCEAICPKSGAEPTWLSFVPWKERVTSRRKKENNHHSKEMLWMNITKNADDPRALSYGAENNPED